MDIESCPPSKRGGKNERGRGNTLRSPVNSKHPRFHHSIVTTTKQTPYKVSQPSCLTSNLTWRPYFPPDKDVGWGRQRLGGHLQLHRRETLSAPLLQTRPNGRMSAQLLLFPWLELSSWVTPGFLGLEYFRLLFFCVTFCLSLCFFSLLSVGGGGLFVCSGLFILFI